MTKVELRRVLVTGGSGYIGAPTVRSLVASGCEVHILGRKDPGIGEATFHSVDLLNEPNLNGLLETINAQVLLHLAWAVTPGKFWDDPANEAWREASKKLFEAFSRSGGERIVGVGSCAEYEWSETPLSEFSSPIRPATLYGQAKATTWMNLLEVSRRTDISVAWARIFFLFGPGEPRGKLVSDAISTILQGRIFRATAGLQRRDFVFVQDVAEALAALTLSDVEGPVNVGSGKATTVRNILEQIETGTRSNGLIDFGARPSSENDPPEVVADVGRLLNEVGFEPRFSLREGIAHAVDWWRKAAEAETVQ